MTDKQPEALRMADELEAEFPLMVNTVALLRTQHAELQKWKNVFGHLGTADQCGNEWIRLQDAIERKDALLRQALEAMAHGCPPDCKDGTTDSGGTYPWGEAVLMRCPTCETFDSITKELQ